MDRSRRDLPAQDVWHFQVGEDFCLEEAVRCLRHGPGANWRRPGKVVFDLRGTRDLRTAGLGLMLLVWERTGLEGERFQILYDHVDVARILHLARFQEKFQLVCHGPTCEASLPGLEGMAS